MISNKELNKVIKDVAPEVFNMTIMEREKWNLNLENDWDIKKKKELILNKLFPNRNGNSYISKDFKDKYNLMYTRLNGTYFGSDFFYLNEYERDKLLQNGTFLYDIDKTNFFLQQEFLQQKNKAKEYNQPILGYWARTVRGDKVDYISIDSLTSYLLYQIEENIYDWLEDKFPHQQVSLPDDNKKLKNGNFVFSMTQKANRIEDNYAYKKLYHFFIKKLTKRIHKELNHKYKDLNYIWIKEDKDESGKYSREFSVIISGSEILKEIDIRTFWSDIKRLQKRKVEEIKSIISLDLDYLVQKETDFYLELLRKKLKKIEKKNKGEQIISSIDNYKNECLWKTLGYKEKKNLIFYLNKQIFSGNKITEKILFDTIFLLLDPESFDEESFSNIYNDYLDSLVSGKLDEISYKVLALNMASRIHDPFEEGKCVYDGDFRMAVRDLFELSKGVKKKSKSKLKQS